MAFVLGRIAYTHYKRSKNDFPFAAASTAGPVECVPPRSSSRDTPEKSIECFNEKADTFVAERELSTPSAQLGTPFAILPQYIAKTPTTIIMKERVLSLPNGAFHVRSTSGEDLFVIKAETFSCSHRKLVYDAKTTQHLFTLRKDVLTVPRCYYVEDPAGNKVLDLEGKFFFGQSKAVGHFMDAFSGEIESLFMKGSWFNRHAVITDQRTGAEVANIDRKLLNARQLLGGRQTYNVRVAEGVDVSLIMAMCVGLDERRD